MPAINFKQRFAGSVAIGKKRQTIRLMRKIPIREGDTLHLFTGMRTKSCVKLGQAVCLEARAIRITESGVKLDGVALAPAHILKIARDDGFDNALAFKAFFKNHYGFPFHGQLIRW
jgi:hypothetical protein